MKSSLSMDELYLLSLLRLALNGALKEERLSYSEITSLQWSTIITLAEKHGVLSLLYDPLSTRNGIPSELLDKVRCESHRTVLQYYRLLYISNDIVHLLEREKITVILLKGVETASLYKTPELRKSGDVDLLLGNIRDKQKACEVLEANAYTIKNRQHSNHHIEFVSKEGVVVELHTMLVEPFDNQQINHYLAALVPEYQRKKHYVEIMGSTLPIPGEAYHALYLLLHMLQHFLRAGFGLKLLCDWVVLWNRGMDENERQSYLTMVKECGLSGFSDMVTTACVVYLGLDESRANYFRVKSISLELVEDFMKETLEAEEFGQSGKDRMVVVRDASIIGYAREFHHQMQLNYPTAGGYAVFWPVLWILTLMIFLYNNRKIRKVSARAILVKAKIRSRNLKAMKLFDIERQA